MFGKKAKRIKELEAQVAELVKANNILSGNVEVLQIKADAYDKAVYEIIPETESFSLVTYCVSWYLATNLCATAGSSHSLWYQAFQGSPEEKGRAQLPGAEAEGSVVSSVGPLHAAS